MYPHSFDSIDAISGLPSSITCFEYPDLSMWDVSLLFFDKERVDIAKGNFDSVSPAISQPEFYSIPRLNHWAARVGQLLGRHHFVEKSMYDPGKLRSQSKGQVSSEPAKLRRALEHFRVLRGTSTTYITRVLNAFFSECEPSGGGLRETGSRGSISVLSWELDQGRCTSMYHQALKSIY